jgi:hypothetical protein
LLAETKVSDSNVAFFVQEHVLWLEVSVDDSVFVKTPNGVNNFCGVDLSPLFVEPLFLPEVGEQFSSVQEIDNKVKLCLGLEGVVKPHDVWVLNFFQNVSFGYKGDKKGRLTYLGF